MRVLYITHVGNLAGAARSLLELILSFPKNKIHPHIISPEGMFADEIRAKRIPIINTIGISQFDNTQYSFYRKLRWIIILREFFLFFCTLKALIKAKKLWGNFDVIHINEITMLPAIILAKLIFKKSKLLVHVRSKQRQKNNIRLKLINYFLRKNVDVLISIDKNVSNSLHKSLSNTIIHNGLNLKSRKIKYKKNDKNFTVNMVGMIHKSKGCFDFVNAARICVEKGYEISFVFHGSENYRPNTILNKTLKLLDFKQDVSLEIKELIHELNLSKYFHFNIFTTDFNKIYSNQNILCFTSVLNSPGRPVFEAAYFKVPSILAIFEPMNDTFIDGETGLTYLSSDYKDLANKIMYLYDNPKIRSDMGEKAFALADKNFDQIINSEKVLKKYQDMIRA